MIILYDGDNGSEGWRDKFQRAVSLAEREARRRSMIAEYVHMHDIFSPLPRFQNRVIDHGITKTAYCPIEELHLDQK